MIGQIILMAILGALGVFTVIVFIDNTRALSEHKALRAELDDIQRECDSIKPCPTDEQLAHLDARIDQYQARFAAFQGNPFVITKGA